jgi:hypothetical protein
MLDELSICKIDIQSFLLLKEGIKPAIRVGIPDCFIENAKKTAKKLGIEILVKEFNTIYGEELSKPLINAYYSLDKKMCREAWLAEKNGDRKRFGRLLGYPECCVDFFIKNLSSGHFIDYTLSSLSVVKTKPSFYCNSLFVFDSKLSSYNMQTYNDNIKIFDKPEHKNLFLIRHVPCSLDCEESIKIGKITLKLLEKEYPQLAVRIVNALKKPVLYWNYFEWIIFNGNMQNEKIKYDGILNYESLVKMHTKKMIESGNNIKIEDDKIAVLKNRENIGYIERKDGIPMFIDFQ